MFNMQIQWIQSPTAVWVPGFNNYTAAIRLAVAEYGMTVAPQIENWMRQNARWEDVTGEARRQLHAEVQVMLNEVVILLSHGVDYGIFLELLHAGEYEILGPAVDHWGPIVMRQISRIMS